MLTFKYAELKNPSVATAIGKLKSADTLPPKTAYSVIKIVRWLQSEEKIAQELIQKIGMELSEKDEQGKLKEPNGPGSWSIPEANHKAFQEKMEEWAKIESSYDWGKLSAKELEAAKLSPGELLACEWFIDLDSLIA